MTAFTAVATDAVTGQQGIASASFTVNDPPIFEIPNPITNSGSTSWASISAAIGTVKGFRGYNATGTGTNGVPPSFPGAPAGPIPAGVTTAVISFKPVIADVATGQLDSAILTFLSDIPADLTVYVTAWHEGERAGATPSALIAMHEHLQTLVYDNTPPNVMYGQVFMSYTATTYSSHYPLSQWVAPGLDWYGLDCYMATQEDTWQTTIEPAQAQLESVVTNPKLLICESNCLAAAGFTITDAQNAQWFSDMWAWWQENPSVPLISAYYGNSPDVWPPGPDTIAELQTINQLCGG